MNSEKIPGTIIEKNWAVAVHLASLSVFLGLPFFNVIGPFIIWIVHKDKYPFVYRHGCESLNFQLSISLICFPVLILFFVPIVNFLIRPLAVVILLFAIYHIIKASLKAKRGEYYKYPMTIKIFK